MGFHFFHIIWHYEYQELMKHMGNTLHCRSCSFALTINPPTPTRSHTNKVIYFFFPLTRWVAPSIKEPLHFDSNFTQQKYQQRVSISPMAFVYTCMHSLWSPNVFHICFCIIILLYTFKQSFYFPSW